MPTPQPSDDPLYSGELRARAELTFAAVLRALLVVLPVLVAASLLGNSTRAESLALALTLPFTLALFVLQRRGHFQLCIYAAVFGLIVFSAGIAALYGSVRSVGTLGQVAAITVGGLFLPRRALLSATALSFASIAALIYAELAGWLPKPNYEVTAAHWVAYGAIIAGVALVLAYMRSMLVDLVREFRGELVQRRKAEAERLQSDDRFRRVFDSSPVGMTITRISDGRYLEINRADQRTLGYQREEVIGRSTLEMGAWLDPADRARFIALLRADGRVLDYPTRMRHKSGAIIDARMWAELGEFGGEPCVVTFTINVTEQERAERLRQLSETKYEAVFSSSPDPISITREKDSVTLEVNDAWVRTTGYSREHAVGRSALRMGMWTDQQQRAQVIEELQKNGEVHNVPARFDIAQGETLEVLLSGVRVTLDAEPCVLWTWRDVSELRRSQRREEQALEKFTTLFDTNPVGILLTRPRDHRVVEVNDAALALLGLTREAALSMPSLEAIRWRDREARDNSRRRVLAGERVYDQPAKLDAHDGVVRDTLTSAAQVRVDGELLVMITIRDVTEQLRQQRALKESEGRFEKAFHASREAIAISDLPEGRLVSVNRRGEELYGARAVDMLGRTAAELCLWDAATADRIAGLMRGDRKVQNIELNVTTRGGETRICEYSADIVDLGGQPHAIAFLRDITEQRNAEEELRSNRRLLESVIDAIPMSIFAKDLDSRYIMLNKGMAEYFGVPKETLLLQHTSRLPAPDAARAKALADDAWVFANQRTLDQPDQLLERPDGTLLRYHSTKIPLFDQDGKLMGLLGINRDISEEKLAQESRRRNEALLDNIAKSVGAQTGEDFFRSLVLALGADLPADMVFIGELVGGGESVRTIACCRDGALVENFEYALRGSPCVFVLERRGTVVHPERVAALFPEDAGLVRHAISGYAGTSLFDASGKAIGILVALTRKPIERKEFVVSMLEIFAARAAAEIARARADATARELNISLERRVRERTMELETANRDLDSFGYSVSHDLRAPLGALNGFAHLLRAREAGQLSGDGVHLLRQIETNAMRMTNLVEGLLEFSRLGRKPVTRIAVPMASLAGEVVDELRAATGGRRVEFRVGPIAAAYGDPVLLRQVWRNLVGNAVKYTRGRDPAVIEIGSDPATGEYFVRDNGAGFDMQYAERLFGVFERLHGESEFEGTGIGLAIVQRVVNRHGGAVRGEGYPGRGATFRFTLPSR